MSWPDYTSWNYAPMYPALSPAPAPFPLYPSAQPNPYYCNYELGSPLRLTSVHSQPPPGMNPRYSGHEMPQCTANQHMLYPYAYTANVPSGQTPEHLHRANSQAHGCTAQKDKNSAKSGNTDNGGTETWASTANEVLQNKINTAELATNMGLEINPGVTTFTDSHGRTWVCESDRARRGEQTVSSEETNGTQQVASVSSPDSFQAETNGCVSNNDILSACREQPPERKPSLNTHERTDASEESPAAKISSSILKETKTLIRKVLATNDIPTLLIIEHIIKITNKVISSIRNTKLGVCTQMTTEELINVINKIISFVMTLLNAMKNTGGDVMISPTGERSLDEQIPERNSNCTLSKVNKVDGSQSRNKLPTAEVHTRCHETARTLFSNHQSKHSNQSKDTPSNSEAVDANKSYGAIYRLCPAFEAQCSGNNATAGNSKHSESQTNTQCMAESEPTDVAQSVGKVISAMTWTPIITDEMNGGTEYPATTVHKTDGQLMYLPRPDYVYSAETSSWEINDKSDELKKKLTFNHSPGSKFKNYSSYKEHYATSKIKQIPGAYTDYNKQNYTPRPVGLHTGTPKNVCKSKPHYHGKSECQDYTDYRKQSYTLHPLHTTKNACSKTHFHTSQCQVSVHADHQDSNHPATEQCPTRMNSAEQHCCSGARTKHKCTKKTCSGMRHRDYHVPCTHKHATCLTHESSFDRLSLVGSAMVPLRRTKHDECTIQTRPTAAATHDLFCRNGASVEQCTCYVPSNVESLKLITIFPGDKYNESDESEANEDVAEDMNPVRSAFKKVQTTTTNNDTRESDNSVHTD